MREEKGGKSKHRKRALVQSTADEMRELVLAHAPEQRIGSLGELAQLLGVGIVTVQQAARILEHEGLLEVRRGPGGGYYGTRPDEAALERSIAAYMRVHGSGFFEARDMMSLLYCELVSAAASCDDQSLREDLHALTGRIDSCDTEEQRLDFELDLQNLIFKMVKRPFIELLSRVTMQLYRATPIPPVLRGKEGVTFWKASRHRVIDAILAGDEQLARFEATRYRDHLLRSMREIQKRAEVLPLQRRQS